MYLTCFSLYTFPYESQTVINNVRSNNISETIKQKIYPLKSTEMLNSEMYILDLQLTAEKYMKTQHRTYIKCCFYIAHLKDRIKFLLTLNDSNFKGVLEDNFSNQHLQCMSTMLTHSLCYRQQSIELHTIFPLSV